MEQPSSRRPTLAARVLCWAAVAAVLVAGVGGYASLLQSVHHLSEVLVHVLP